MEQKRNLPTMQELVSGDIALSKQNDLNVLLNQPPPDSWLKDHPTATKKYPKTGRMEPIKYIPIERIEYLLTRLFVKWRVEVKQVQLIANSVQVTVRVHYKDPITGEWDWHDGVGANPIQTEKGAGAADWDKIKSAAVQMAAPAAKSYAIKDAAEHLGKLFGKDMNRADEIGYDSMLGQHENLKELSQKLSEAINYCQDDELKSQVLDLVITAEESGQATADFYREQLKKFGQ